MNSILNRECEPGIEITNIFMTTMHKTNGNGEPFNN